MSIGNSKAMKDLKCPCFLLSLTHTTPSDGRDKDHSSLVGRPPPAGRLRPGHSTTVPPRVSGFYHFILSWTIDTQDPSSRLLCPQYDV